MDFPKVPIFLLVGLLAILVGLQVNGIFDKFQLEPEWMYPDDNPYEVAHYTYLKRIPVNPDDPALPQDINREYTYDDFAKYFNVHQLHKVVYDNKLKLFMDRSNLEIDKDLFSYPPGLESLAEKAKTFVDNPVQSDDRFVVKWSSKETGFGLFAKKPIAKGDILGLYTGVVNLKPDSNTDFMWEISHIKLANGEVYNLSINSRKAGNYLRFVNHVGETANALAFTMRYKGEVHCIYFAVNDIEVGEELLTNYGDKYFETRKMVVLQ